MYGFEYVAPETLDDALGLVREHGDDAKILAGGQSLIPILHYRLARPRVVIDINSLPLGDVTADDGRLRIGALVRYPALEESATIARRDRLGRVDDAGLAFGGVADRPVHALAAEDALRGHEPTADVVARAARVARDALDPPSDAFVSGAYRRHVAGVLCRRALTRAVARALA